MPSDITCYLFDLDDTIIDSSIYSKMYNELLREIVIRMRISEIELQKEITELKKKTGKEKPDTFELCNNLRCTELYYEMLEKYARHTYTLKTPSIPAIMRKIKAAKKQIGIVSGSQEKTVRIFLDRFNIAENVDFIYSGNKNTVLFWIQLEKKHSFEKSTTLVIDDSDEVLEIAERAGFKVLNVKNIASPEKFEY